MRSNGEPLIPEPAAGFSLAQLQGWMQGQLLDAPVVDSAPLLPVAQLVHASQRLSAEQHIAIYQHSYVSRLRACMQSQFPALAYALGEELFQLFADQYLDTCPSRSYTLNTLGEGFPAFLEETRPDAAAEVRETWPDFMIELAGFEYALSVLFDAPGRDEQPEPTLDTPEEQVQLAPVLQAFHHRHPICAYYTAFSQGKEPELPLPEDSYCVVTRHQYKLALHPVKERPYYFLKNLQEGHSFEDAKEQLRTALGTSQEDFCEAWPVWKGRFLDSGFLATKAPGMAASD